METERRQGRVLGHLLQDQKISDGTRPAGAVLDPLVMRDVRICTGARLHHDETGTLGRDVILIHCRMGGTIIDLHRRMLVDRDLLPRMIRDHIHHLTRKGRVHCSLMIEDSISMYHRMLEGPRSPSSRPRQDSRILSPHRERHRPTSPQRPRQSSPPYRRSFRSSLFLNRAPRPSLSSDAAAPVVIHRESKKHGDVTSCNLQNNDSTVFRSTKTPANFS